MHIYEYNAKQAMGDEEFPLKSLQAKVTMSLDYGTLDVPRKASRKAAIQSLKEIVAELEAEDLSPITAEPTPAPDVVIEALEERVDYGSRLREKDHWEKPDNLDMRLIKSAHRFVSEVSKRSEGGRPVLAAEVVGSAGLSAPTVSRLLKEDEEVAQYLAPFIRVTPHGRTKSVDLTPEGRMLASKIRARVIPS